MVIIVIHSIQKWLPFEKILENGIIKLKNNSYIMILKIKPINYNLKSNLEKESILNSYKLFLKSFNFNIQIIIKSQKQDLSNHIIKIINSQKKESQIIKNISNKYLENIEKINSHILHQEYGLSQELKNSVEIIKLLKNNNILTERLLKNEIDKLKAQQINLILMRELLKDTIT